MTQHRRASPTPTRPRRRTIATRHPRIPAIPATVGVPNPSPACLERIGLGTLHRPSSAEQECWHRHLAPNSPMTTKNNLALHLSWLHTARPHIPPPRPQGGNALLPSQSIPIPIASVSTPAHSRPPPTPHLPDHANITSSIASTVSIVGPTRESHPQRTLAQPLPPSVAPQRGLTYSQPESEIVRDEGLSSMSSRRKGPKLLSRSDPNMVEAAQPTPDAQPRNAPTRAIGPTSRIKNAKNTGMICLVQMRCKW